MTTASYAGPIVIAPHHFPDLQREHALANELNLQLIATPDKAAFRDAVVDAQIAMITPYATLTAEDFGRMKRCRGVVRYGMGYDNIDVPAATEAGIPVSIVPGASNEEVASHAVAMGLALVRRLTHGHDAISDGGWNGDIAYDTPKISDLEVGIVGMGRIGQIAARMYSGIGARVSAYDPFAKFTDVKPAALETILETSDVVSLHVPLSTETRNLISSDVLARMKAGSVVVNVSRGGLVDETALASALRSGHLAGAALDVFSEEPLPTDHVLRGVPGLILTPHIAWRSNKSLGAIQQGAVDRARLALTGQTMPDTVN
jgi:D-3-phosphoglycerate dehydrogenase / 2-oxoglutarate reductase